MAGIRTSYSFNIRERILVPVGKKNVHVFSYGIIVKLCCVTVQNKEKISRFIYLEDKPVLISCYGPLNSHLNYFSSVDLVIFKSTES